MPEAGPTLSELESVSAGAPAESVRESLMAALTGEPLEHAAGPDPTVPAETGVPADALNVYLPETGEPARDPETGRFVAREGEEPPPATGEPPIGEPPPATGTPPVGEPPPATGEPLEPLPAWTLDEQEAFRKLTPGDQKWILDRATPPPPDPELTGVNEVLAPYREAIRVQGLTPSAYLQQTLHLATVAAQRPADFAEWFLTQRNIDPLTLPSVRARLGNVAPSEPAAAPVEGEDPEVTNDPVVRAVRAENAKLWETINQMQQQFTSVREEASRSEGAENVRIVEAFQGEKNAEGQLAHPYFEQVRRHMAVIWGSDLAPDLETAYEMACKADPEVSAKLAAAERARADRTRQREEAEKAEKARRAAATVSGTPAAGGVTPPPVNGSVRDIVRGELLSGGLIPEGSEMI